MALSVRHAGTVCRRQGSSHRAAVMLDKDGTLLENIPYNVDPARMRLAPGAAEALHLLGQLDMPLVVVSNQPGVALGYFPEQALRAVRARLAELFAAHGARLAGFFYCPHHPDGTQPALTCTCPCRKPRAGLLWQAAARLGLALEASWMIGDILDDVAAGNTAQCRTILVDCGSETEWLHGAERVPDYTVTRLDAAAHIVAWHRQAASGLAVRARRLA